MPTEVVSSQAPAPAITDPGQLSSERREGVQALSIEKLYHTRMVGAAAWSPDGERVCFVSNMSGRQNLWIVPASGGWPVQLTISEQRQAAPAWSPDGRWICYMQDQDGDEQWDLLVVSPLNGEVRNLTRDPGSAAEAPAWSPDGRTIAYQRKPKDSSTYEIELLEVETGERRAVTQGTPKELGNFGPLWSRDGRLLAYTQAHATGKDSSVFVADLGRGDHRNLTPHSGELVWQAQDWSSDNASLLVTSNALNGHDNAAQIELASGRVRWLTQERWEVTAGHFSPDGRLVTWSANVDGNGEALVCDLGGGSARRLPLPPGMNSFAGAESAFSGDGARLLCYHNGPDMPNDLWVCPVDGTAPRQITHALVAGARPRDMVAPALVHFPSADGRHTISSFAYVPINLERDGSHPAIVYIHGGPQAQSVNSFQRIVQYLVNRGYLVIAPNYRGSTGYGKEFQDANRFDMGGGDLADVLAAAEWIARSGYVDRRKLVVMGGSYGGYLTMMAVTKSPQTWAAGVAIVPFVNWFTEVEHEDPLLREYDLATMGDPVENRALWEDRSPIHFVERITAPLLLLAGAQDPRCPVSEAEQVEWAVKARGGVVELKVYTDEGHGFARVENLVDAYSRVAEFLRRHVPPAERKA